MPIKYLVYRGIYFDGFIQPAQFNEYDVVLITYDYLRMDFNDYKYNVSTFYNEIIHSESLMHKNDFLARVKLNNVQIHIILYILHNIAPYVRDN